MKVLQIAFNDLNIGGVQKDIIDITENVSDCHFDVVVFFKEKGYFEKRFIELGGTVFRITEYEGNNRLRKFLELFFKKFRIFFKTYKILKKYGPYDAIHSHNKFRSGFTNAAAFFAGVKIRISHGHIDKPPEKYSLFKEFLFVFYRILTLIFSNVRLACSEKAAKYLFWKAKRAEIVLNGADLKKFDIDKYPYEYKEFTQYIHVGRYVVQKNQLFLLDIFANILKQQSESHLSLIGYGADESMIIERISKPDLAGKVDMYPPDSDVPKMLSESNFMIFPSLYEGFPNVQIEAQVMGVKCFVSDTVTTESDLGLSTYISLDKSPAEWADIIVEEMKNHDFSSRPQISQTQLDRVDIVKICRRYRDIYEGNLSKTD